MQRLSTEIAVIGAGVIGLSIAERLVAEGHEVTLIDPGEPGMAASYGNAGTIADYAVAPVGTPAVLKNLPSLLFDRNSPLSIRHSALASLTPWLLRFAWQSLPGPAARNARALAGLLAGTGKRWKELAQRCEAEGLMEAGGGLYLYQTEAALAAAAKEMEARRAYGIAVEMIDRQQLAALEPRLQGMAGAASFTGAIFLPDPGRMMQQIAATVLRRASLVPARIGRLNRQATGISLEGRMTDGRTLHLLAQKVVIAAGAHSRSLARQAGDRIPLDTERGYHVEWDMEELPISRPSCVTSRGFYLCPMQGRLRAAGTVELGGLTAPPSPHRIAKLVEGARSVFPDLGEPSRSWMGFRPSIPDSLPVIGPSRGGADVLHAYGHGHIGITLAPVTAEIIAAQIRGEDPGDFAAAASPLRF